MHHCGWAPTPYCPACPGILGSQKHILTRCCWTAGLVTERHNLAFEPIVSLINSHSSYSEVWEGKINTLRWGCISAQPDLVLVNEPGWHRFLKHCLDTQAGCDLPHKDQVLEAEMQWFMSSNKARARWRKPDDPVDSVCIVEFTCAYDDTLEQRINDKLSKYRALQHIIKQHIHNSNLTCVAVGCLGTCHSQNRKKLHKICCKEEGANAEFQKAVTAALKKSQAAAAKGSHGAFSAWTERTKARNHQ